MCFYKAHKCHFRWGLCPSTPQVCLAAKGQSNCSLFSHLVAWVSISGRHHATHEQLFLRDLAAITKASGRPPASAPAGNPAHFRLNLAVFTRAGRPWPHYVPTLAYRPETPVCSTGTS